MRVAGLLELVLACAIQTAPTFATVGGSAHDSLDAEKLSAIVQPLVDKAVQPLLEEVLDLKSTNADLAGRVDNLQQSNSYLKETNEELRRLLLANDHVDDNEAPLQSHRHLQFSDDNQAKLDAFASCLTTKPGGDGNLVYIRHCDLLVRDGDHIVENGNLHVRSGEHNTAGAINGKGNVIIGYDEGHKEPELTKKTGSHNLVVGSDNSYTSYGGIVAGHYNKIQAPYASVLGGHENVASGEFSSVLGGTFNEAEGYRSSVSGGFENLASGRFASVSGGAYNEASGGQSSVSGGSYNIASGQYASVSGGGKNIAAGYKTSVSGGKSNYAEGPASSVSGGNGEYTTLNLQHLP